MEISVCLAAVAVHQQTTTTFTPLPLNIALCQHRNLHVIQKSNALAQIVDGYGRIVKEGPLYSPAILVADVPRGGYESPTLFTRWGDWFAHVCLIRIAAGTWKLRRR